MEKITHYGNEIANKVVYSSQLCWCAEQKENVKVVNEWKTIVKYYTSFYYWSLKHALQSICNVINFKYSGDIV